MMAFNDSGGEKTLCPHKDSLPDKSRAPVEQQPADRMSASDEEKHTNHTLPAFHNDTLCTSPFPFVNLDFHTSQVIEDCKVILSCKKQFIH